MPNIDEDLQRIMQARYGREVRGSIHDAIYDINEVADNAESVAITSQASAQTMATRAESYTQGGTGTRIGEDTDNAEYYYHQSKNIADTLGSILKPCGTVTFENLPNLATEEIGNTYNVSNAFTSDSRFEDGGSISYPKGSNVYKTISGLWDVLAGNGVVGVKGNSESAYRTGNVNITKANIGLGNTSNLAITDTYSATSSNGMSGKAVKNAITPLENRPNIINATCTTASDQQVKVITLPSGTTLKDNDILSIIFENTNTYNATASAPVTFTIGNDTYNVYQGNGTSEITGTNTSFLGNANFTISYKVDVTNKKLIWHSKSWDNNTTYTNASLGQGYGTSATAASTLAKVVTLASYSLVVGGIVSVKFTYSVPANATMNINSRGAKPIYYHDSPIISGVINGGEICTFMYDGSKYHLISIDVQGSASASNVIYNNTLSGLSATNVQDATDELASEKIDKTAIANNLTTTSSGKVLDARQGKALNDEISNMKATNNASLTETLTPRTINSVIGTSTGSWYYKIGTRVRMKLAVTGITAQYANQTLFTLPVGFRPYSGITLLAEGADYSKFTQVTINSNGVVQVYAATTTATYCYIEFDAFN